MTCAALADGAVPVGGTLRVMSTRAAFDPRTMPCTFLADQTGTVRHINRGFGGGYETRVEQWPRSMLAGR
jgi:hypothetical protein